MNIDNLQDEELFTFLRENKNSLIQAKKASIKLCDSIISPVVIAPREPKEKATKDASEDPSSSEPDTIKVTIVANVANIVDSQMDMLTDGAYSESIKARGNTIPHIADHNQVSTAHVADVQKVYTKKLPLATLGMDVPGETTALLFDSIVRKDYNPNVYKFYANEKINQHSIGINYGEIKMAINSSHEADTKEKAIWDEYYPKVINKDAIDKKGYFWVIPKVDVREVSSVLFGSNPLTPTLSIKSAYNKLLAEAMDLQNSPLGNTPIQPIGKTMTMTLEEAQGKIISLTEELSKAKDAISLAKLEAKSQEKARISNILKAQAVFGSDIKLQKAALSFIEKDLDVETATTSFEVIKEALQTSNHIDSTQTESSLNKDDVNGKELSPKDQLMAIAAAKQTKPDFGDML